MTLGPTYRRIQIAAVAVSAAISLAAYDGAHAQDQDAAVFGPAIDWKVLARLRESVEIDSNRQLNGGQDLDALGRVGLDLIVQGVSKRGAFSVQTGFDGGLSTNNDVDNLNRIDPNVSISGSYRLSKLTSFITSLTARTNSTTVTEVEEGGEVDVNATRFDLAASAGLSWALTKRDSFSFNTTAQIVDFSRSVGSFTPSQTFGVNAGWSHRTTETTSLSLSGSFRNFDADGASNRSSQTFSLTGGIDHRRTPRHNLGGTLGFTVVSSDQQNGPSNTTVGVVGSGRFGYTLDDLTANFAFNQAVQPSSDGELDLFLRLSGNVSYRLNDLQSFGLGTNYVRRSDISGGGDVQQFVSFGPNYSYSLTEDTSLQLGYQFRLRDSEIDGFNTAHRVTLSLSHNLTLLD